jgi:hypothetical protein
VWEIDASKIEGANIDQSVLGRLMNFGAVTMRGVGTGYEPIRHIADPLALRRAVGQITGRGS